MLAATAILLSMITIALALVSYLNPQPEDSDALIGPAWLSALSGFASVLLWTLTLYAQGCESCASGPVVATALGIAAAAFTGGFLLGFIFGIPRSMPYASATLVTAPPGGPPIVASAQAGVEPPAAPPEPALTPTSTAGSPTADAEAGRALPAPAAPANTAPGRTTPTAADGATALRSSQPSGDQNSQGYRANTNLEDVSDWLTKLLIGAGLVQLSSIRNSLAEVQTTVNRMFDAGERGGRYVLATRRPDAPGAGVLALTILLFSAAGGFLFGYVWSRVVLPIAFIRADRAVQRVRERLQRPSGTTPSAG
jgi:hypothetical protein